MEHFIGLVSKVETGFQLPCLPSANCPCAFYEHMQWLCDFALCSSQPRKEWRKAAALLGNYLDYFPICSQPLGIHYSHTSVPALKLPYLLVVPIWIPLDFLPGFLTLTFHVFPGPVYSFGFSVPLSSPVRGFSVQLLRPHLQYPFPIRVAWIFFYSRVGTENLNEFSKSAWSHI